MLPSASVVSPSTLSAFKIEEKTSFSKISWLVRVVADLPSLCCVVVANGILHVRITSKMNKCCKNFDIDDDDDNVDEINIVSSF